MTASTKSKFQVGELVKHKYTPSYGMIIGERSLPKGGKVVYKIFWNKYTWTEPVNKRKGWLSTLELRSKCNFITHNYFSESSLEKLLTTSENINKKEG